MTNDDKVNTYNIAYDILLISKEKMSIKNKIKMIQLQLDTLCLKVSAKTISDYNHDIKESLK